MLLNEVDNMVRGLEIVVKDDEVGYVKKDEDPVDYTRAFTTYKVCTYPPHNMLYSVCAMLYVFLHSLQKFQCHHEPFDWAKMVGRENNIVVVTLKYDYGGGKRKEVVILGCEHGGKYKPYKGKLTNKSSKTQKCECPFKLRGRPSKSEGCWKVKVVCGFR